MEKVAVVTGANKGLGYELVKGLCERFFGRVYLTSRDEKRGTEACEKLKNEGLSPEYHQLDITNSESIKRFVYFIQNKHGLIDLLINNAGILFLKDAQEPKSEQVDNTLLVNFDSVVSFTELMLPYIKEDGIILNISSSSGHLSRIPSDEIKKKLANPGLTLAELDELVQDYKDAVKNGSDEEMWGSSPYVVSKVALNAYTFILNRRLSDKGIRANCVHPGYVKSDMTKGLGTITPEDAAKVPLEVALEAEDGGLYVWHDGTRVQWDGPDPRGYIDNIL
ncbi:unnamed protein product [Leptidea sinapis]|uniref:carbonyl reductase (NADPH) n=1 Tax=Leptidea sinapis TaxID=189913 RepID=A0A5E4PVU0_9NEOP|nr:unnamed protein product [Leptidea sinapis]